MYEIECSVCQGTGTVTADFPTGSYKCYICHGTGTLEKTEAQLKELILSTIDEISFHQAELSYLLDVRSRGPKNV